MFTQIATVGILCLYTCKFIKIQWEKYDLKNVERADRFDEKNLFLQTDNILFQNQSMAHRLYTLENFEVKIKRKFFSANQ